jgi:PAS domain S-box-containing protein
MSLPGPFSPSPPDAAAWLAAIVQSCDDAVVGKSLDGTIVSWNEGAERLYGYAAHEAIGQPIAILVPEDQPDELPDIMDRLRRGIRIEHYETRRLHKDGTPLHVSVTISPVRNPAGEIVGASAVTRDITERRQLERERSELLARERAARAESERVRELAEAANRAKDEFLAILSHELRTPLNAIAGWLRVLALKSDDPVMVQRALSVGERNVKLMAKLIDDLLDVSRIVAGRMQIERVAIDVLPLVETVIDEMRLGAADKGIELRSRLDPWVGTVLGDPDRLQQVLMNLIGNAIKFTPAGGAIELRAEASRTLIRIVVQDTGRGIPAEFLPYVFDRFRQAQTGVTRTVGGLGLGLAIVKHIVEQHGGRVHAASPGEGRGSQFTVELPILKDWPPVS